MARQIVPAAPSWRWWKASSQRCGCDPPPAYEGWKVRYGVHLDALRAQLGGLWPRRLHWLALVTPEESCAGWRVRSPQEAGSLARKPQQPPGLLHHQKLTPAIGGTAEPATRGVHCPSQVAGVYTRLSAAASPTGLLSTPQRAAPPLALWRRRRCRAPRVAGRGDCACPVRARGRPGPRATSPWQRRTRGVAPSCCAAASWARARCSAARPATACPVGRGRPGWLLAGALGGSWQAATRGGRRRRPGLSRSAGEKTHPAAVAART